MPRLVPTQLLALLGFWCATASASVQTCNTRCQTEQTDCTLRCDGNIPCIVRCQTSADSCADACLKQ